MNAGAGSTRVRRHVFEPDPDLAREYVPSDRRSAGLGPRRWCRRCGLPGEPGDQRHHAPPDPHQLAASVDLDRRRLGERDDKE